MKIGVFIIQWIIYCMSVDSFILFEHEPQKPNNKQKNCNLPFKANIVDVVVAYPVATAVSLQC